MHYVHVSHMLHGTAIIPYTTLTGPFFCFCFRGTWSFLWGRTRALIVN